MSAFLVQSVKVLVTEITLESTLHVMRLSVFRQIGRFAKRLAANLALEWLLACVGSLVHC